MERHVFRPGRRKSGPSLPIAAGLLATFGVFVIIPLTQKLSDATSPTMPPAPEFALEAPEEMDFEPDKPPEKPEPEPEPEEMMKDATDLDVGMDLAELSLGTGGGFLIKVPTFGLGGGDSPFGSGGLDGPPTPVHKIQPTYPNSLLSSGKGGRVVVRCVVDAAGAVISTKIQSSSGYSELDRAAISAVQRWKFKPATRSGKKVKAVCNVPFNFEVRK